MPSAPLSPEAATARAKLARLARTHGPEADVVTEARREFIALRLADQIRRVVDGAPPLTDQQRTRLADLLRPDGAA